MSPTGWQLAGEATGLRSGEGVHLCSSMPWVHHCPLHPDGFAVFACIPFFSLHHPWPCTVGLGPSRPSSSLTCSPHSWNLSSFFVEWDSLEDRSHWTGYNFTSTDRSVSLIIALPDFIIKSVTDIPPLLVTKATWAIHSLFKGQRYSKQTKQNTFLPSWSCTYMEKEENKYIMSCGDECYEEIQSWIRKEDMGTLF